MVNVNAEQTGTPAGVELPEQVRARALAFQLVVDAQVTDTDVMPTTLALAVRARDAGWTDVRAVADYAVATVHFWRSPASPAAAAHTEAFLAWARRTDDPLALGLALCAHVRLGWAGVGGTSARRVDDLVEAYEAAERIRDRIDHAFVLHEVAGELHEMRLWDLTTELYGEVERLTDGAHEPQALVGALAYNRHCTLASELLHATEAGDGAQVRRRAGRVAALRAEPDSPAVPAAWRTGIAAYAAICRTLTTHEGDAAIEELLTSGPGSGIEDHLIAGLLRCVLGWHHLEHGRWDDAEPLVVDGAQVVLDGCDPTFQTFALWLLARIRNRDADSRASAATRRYHRSLVAARETASDALVRSVRARLQTGRLRAERDRYARESLTDPLTGLANRRALESRLATATPSLTLLMVDIDQFKPVNDRFGHDVGDQVLRRIGRILLDCIRPGDLAARLGGDEFVLLLEAADRDVGIRRGYEVRDRVRTEPWHELRVGLQVAVSVGVAWGARTGSALYRQADESLYEAKRAGGARVRGVRAAASIGDDRT
jgi:diguanylate cyclase (GGDEF)-like protein